MNMENIIIAALGEYSDYFNDYLPAGVSKDWKTKYGYIPTGFKEWNETLKEQYDFFFFLRSDKYKPKDQFYPHLAHLELGYNIKYLPINEIGVDTPYLYIVNIFSPNFFVDTGFDGFKSYDKRVINDVINGRCKIILIQDREGMSGLPKDVTDFEIIEFWAREVNINPKDIHYIHGNGIGGDIVNKLGLTMNYHYVSLFEASSHLIYLSYDYKDIVEYKPDNNNFLYINLNRRPRTHRIWFLYHLYKNNLFDRGKNSYNFFDDDFEWWVSIFNLWYRREISRTDDLSEFYNFVKNLYEKGPMIVDENTDSEFIDKVYPIKHIEKCFLYLVTETLVDDYTLFITEKTFKPLAMGVPFIVLGNINTLKTIKEMGYKTFDKWWDESYDGEIDINRRIERIINILKDYSTKSPEELKIIRDEMSPILEHNKNIFTKRVYENHYMSKKLEPLYNRGDTIVMSSSTYRIIEKIWKELLDNNKKND